VYGLDFDADAIRNAVTGSWDAIGPATRVTRRGTSVTMAVPDAGDYVSGSGVTRVRISTRAPAASNPDGVALGIDEVELTVTE
jgi:hypothetical protein